MNIKKIIKEEIRKVIKEGDVIPFPGKKKEEKVQPMQYSKMISRWQMLKQVVVLARHAQEATKVGDETHYKAMMSALLGLMKSIENKEKEV